MTFPPRGPQRRKWHRYIHALAMAAVFVGCGQQDTLADTLNTDVAAATVTIATFNIQVFGKSKRSRPAVMEVLADIADEFDIMAVQEVRDVSGETPQVYLDAMNAHGDESHEMVVGPRLGRSRSKEQYIFYYDTNVVDIVGEPWTYPDPGDIFEREPLLARFRVGDFDFVLANIHVKPNDALAEIDALDAVHEWAVAQYGDDDVVILGDFNADCSYFKERTQRDVLDMNWITPAGLDTTVKDTDCTYDHFVVSDSLRASATQPPDTYRFDMAYGLGRKAATEVSDHYPVFTVFATGAR
jgi:deoxyribonuclease-1-like protein